MRYQIELPLPPKALSPNFRGHTRERARWVKRYRYCCLQFYKAAKLPTIIAAPSPQAAPVKVAPIKPVIVHLDFYLAPKVSACGQKLPDGCYRPRDEDGARGAFKAGQDALVDAGIIPDDSKKYVRMGYTKIHSTQKQHGGKTMVVLTLELEN